MHLRALSQALSLEGLIGPALIAVLGRFGVCNLDDNAMT